MRLSTLSYEDSASSNIQGAVDSAVEYLENVFGKVYVYMPCKNSKKYEYVSCKRNMGDITHKYQWIYGKS